VKQHAFAGTFSQGNCPSRFRLDFRLNENGAPATAASRLVAVRTTGHRFTGAATDFDGSIAESACAKRDFLRIKGIGRRDG
jgi:hypothetical protein